jgi:voltage-gated sodium channel
LQLLVGALIKSIPSMGYVGVLLLMHFYVYAVTGVFLFRDNDPVHFRDLPTSMLSLFRVVTLEDWTDIMYIQMYGSDVYAYDNFTDLPNTPSARPVVGALYFVSFVMFGTMIMLNLFIGVILNSMNEEQAQRERERLDERLAAGTSLSVSDEIRLIEHQLQELAQSIKLLRVRCDK